jgi:hypothetical protein
MTVRRASPGNLSMLGCGQGFHLWHYRGHEAVLLAERVEAVTQREVCAAGFFDPLGGLLRRGDILYCTCGDGAVQFWVDGVDPLPRPLVRLRVMCRTTEG